jgi:predicted AlkP superfamily pyrophosphatase or phosphodiesterase
LFGVEPPKLSTAEPLGEVIRTARESLAGRPIEKCLLYAPDAIGRDLFRANGSSEQVRSYAPVEVRLRSVYPPKTPVCFASMFTGAGPEGHGIRVYEKPVLGCDTLFDALARAGKKVAIVAVADSSVDRIFRERPIDYYSEDYDDEVTSRVKGLLTRDEHDFILAYHQEYDDLLHDTSPDSPTALKAVDNHIRSFVELAEAAAECWAAYDRLLTFSPDHGAHVDAATGRGDHGDDIPADMEVVHLFGVFPGAR